MDLDPRDALAERGGLEVEQSQPRHADEHQLVGEELGRRGAGQDVFGRDEALGVVAAEPDVERSIRLHRDLEVAQAKHHALAAAVRDPQHRHACGDADHLDG